MLRLLFTSDIEKKVMQMAAKKENRIIISLACTDCKRRNYSTTKNKKTTTARLELKKFCPHDGKHTVHKETK